MLSLGQLGFAYPAEIIGPLLGTPEFLRYMGLIDEAGKPTANAARLEGAMSGVFQVTSHPHLTTFIFGLTLPQGRSLRWYPDWQSRHG